MSSSAIDQHVKQPYKYGWSTDIESELAPKGLSEDTIRLISEKKREPEWMLQWRLKAYRHWLTMEEPSWPKVHHPRIDYQKIIYYSAPKKRTEALTSLDEVDPKLLETYENLEEYDKAVGIWEKLKVLFPNDPTVDAGIQKFKQLAAQKDSLSKQ